MVEHLTSLDDFLKSSWDEVKHYHLTPKQFHVLLSYPELDWKKYCFPKSEKYQGLCNEKAELVLVHRGMMIHTLREKFYIQREGDLLVIPSNLIHSAEIDSKEDCIAYAYYRK